MRVGSRISEGREEGLAMGWGGAISEGRKEGLIR
jgi:hypothetical protein